MDPDAAPEGAPERPLLRAGRVAWAFIGIAATVVVLVYLLGLFRLVVVPFVIALFPAALIAPLTERLKQRGWPDALVASLAVVVLLASLVGVVGGLGWMVANQLGDLGESLQDAYEEISTWIETNLDINVPPADELWEQAQRWAGFGGEGNNNSVGRYATTALELLTGLLLMILTLFFFLKDGERLAGFVLELTPERYEADVSEVGRRVWVTLAGYFRGQIVVAAVDAVLIGVGLLLLGVPLVLPLAVLVFLGGLFPIVGAFTAGAVAALVALADQGVLTAVLVVGLNVLVQQAEGNLLQPFIVGRATKLHPLGVLLALTAGGVTLGILGAFIAVPLLASVVRVVGYLRMRGDVDSPDAVPKDVRPEDAIGKDPGEE